MTKSNTLKISINHSDTKNKSDTSKKTIAVKSCKDCTVMTFFSYLILEKKMAQFFLHPGITWKGHCCYSKLLKHIL